MEEPLSLSTGLSGKKFDRFRQNLVCPCEAGGWQERAEKCRENLRSSMSVYIF
jgi:hypothetical protein